MKKRVKAVVTLSLCIAFCCGMLAACGKTSEDNKPQPTTAATNASTTGEAGGIEFVAADKTNWDKEISIGDKTYTLSIKLDNAGSASLTASEVGGTDTFTQSGSWTYEKGYGYTITVNGYTTKTSFDKASSRQIMYLEISNNGANAGLVQFQAKDSAFRKDIAADYQEYEVRDAEYVFEAVQAGATNNPNSTHLYLEKDGIANSLTYSGSSATYKRGTWVKESNKNITLTIDGEIYNVLYCDVAGKEGYRAVYNSDTMYTNSSVSYTDEDFEGKVVETLYCGEQDYTLKLTARGIANLYKGDSKEEAGSYVKSGDSLKVIIAGSEFVSENGMIRIAYEKQADCCNTTTVDRSFALDGSIPAAPAGNTDAGNGDAASGDNAEGNGDAASGDNAEGNGDAACGADGANGGDAACGGENQ